MKYKSIFRIAILAIATSAFAADHASQYQVGVFNTTDTVNAGTHSNAQNGGIETHTQKYNVHFVRTNDGMYVIESPTSIGKILGNEWTKGDASMNDAHIDWFMDELHEGDKVLFYAQCNKHDKCNFWLPKPDKPGKEYFTQGSFRPDAAKTNTGTLCGTGKLTPAVEAQVCKEK
jgi:hypothetical protein